MSNYRIQVVYQGQKKVIQDLNLDSTVSEFQSMLEVLFGVPSASQHLTFGFPPKKLTGTTLREASLLNGSRVNLSEDSDVKTGVVQGDAEESKDIVYSIPRGRGNGHMVKRDMPPDNSCLFHSVAYTCLGKRDIQKDLRALVSRTVKEHPNKYTSQVLGQSNSSYCQWIMNKDTWGGAIELSIFSDKFETEIVSFDYKYLREDHFGELMGYKKRAFVIYTGQHYDAMAFSPYGNAPEAADKVIFSSSDDYALRRARDYVEFLHNDACNKDSSLTRFKEWRKDREARLAKGHSMVDPTKWSCSNCTFLNNSSSGTCQVCGGLKAPVEEPPASLPVQQPSSGGSNSGGIIDSLWGSLGMANWGCSTCTFSNHYARTDCEMCGLPRSE